MKRKLLDDMWSEAVKKRAGYKCELCGQKLRKPGHKSNLATANAHHILGKSTLWLRYAPESGLCLCSGCHLFGVHSHDPWRAEKYRDKMIEVIGDDRWLRLHLLKWKQGKPNLLEIEAELKRFVK